MLTIPGGYNGQKLDIKVRVLVGSVIHHSDAIIFAEYEFRGVEGEWRNLKFFTLNRPTLSIPSA